MEQSNAVRVLAAMAHDGRLTLLRTLIKAGPDGVQSGELARLTRLNATTVSAQLLVLSNAGLVSSERRGRRVIYCANFEQLSELLSFLLHDCCAGQSRVHDTVAAVSR